MEDKIRIKLGPVTAEEHQKMKQLRHAPNPPHFKGLNTPLGRYLVEKYGEKIVDALNKHAKS